MKKLTIAFITFFLLITTTAITDIVRAKSFVYYSWLGFLPRLIQISDLIFVGEIQSMTNLESTVRVDSCLYGDPGTNLVHLTRWIDWRKGWSAYAETLGPDSGPCVVFAVTNNWWSIFDTDASPEEKKLANRTLLTWDVVTNTPLDHGVFPGWTLPCANDSFYPLGTNADAVPVLNYISNLAHIAKVEHNREAFYAYLENWRTNCPDSLKTEIIMFLDSEIKHPFYEP